MATSRGLLPARTDGGQPRNSPSSLRNSFHAGSSASTRWFRLGSRTNLAPRIPAARRRPSSSGTTPSCSQWKTMVRARISCRNSVMSILPHCSHIRAAFSGEVAIRCISLNHSHCSAVASGIYSGIYKEVQSWRNVACLEPDSIDGRKYASQTEKNPKHTKPPQEHSFLLSRQLFQLFRSPNAGRQGWRCANKYSQHNFSKSSLVME